MTERSNGQRGRATQAVLGGLAGAGLGLVLLVGALRSGDVPAPPAPAPDPARSATRADSERRTPTTAGPRTSPAQDAPTPAEPRDARAGRAARGEGGALGGQVPAAWRDVREAPEARREAQAADPGLTPVGEGAAGLSGVLGSRMDDTVVDPVAEARARQDWDRALTRTDHHLVEQAAARGLAPARVREVQRALARYREARARALADLRAGRLGRAGLVAAARQAKQARDRDLGEALAPVGGLRALDLAEARFRAARELE